MESTLSLDSDKDGTLLSLGVLGVQRQVGAAHDSDNDLAIDEQTEADGVLTTTEETLGTVDGVESPVAWSSAERLRSGGGGEGRSASWRARRGRDRTATYDQKDLQPSFPYQ